MGSPLETCKSGVAEELIVGYAARTLDPEAEIAFERHLQGCAQCRRLSAQQSAVWSALEAWRPPGISSDFDQKLARHIAENQGSRLSLVAKWVWRPALPLAAVCAVLIGVFFLKDDDRGSARSIVPRPSAQIEQQVEHALDDMDLLKQIGVDVSAERIAPAQKI